MLRYRYLKRMPMYYNLEAPWLEVPKEDKVQPSAKQDCRIQEPPLPQPSYELCTIEGPTLT